MEIENSFTVAAPADRVYGHLLDVNNVVRCVPGAELSEMVDADTFKGKVKIKVGPVTVSYNGTARITERDAANRTATLRAEGRETTGSGSANATTRMSVAEDGASSVVTLATDFTVVGRIAQFGRGIMEDVSKHLVGQMAECIRATLEAGDAGGGADAGTAGADGAATGGWASTSGPSERVTGATAAGATAEATAPGATAAQAKAASAARAAAPAAEIDAFALGRAVAKDRISRAGPAPIAAGAVSFGLLILLLVLLRRRRG